MAFYKSILVTATILTLGACTVFEGKNEVEKLNEAVAAGSPFSQQLTAEYRAFSNYELKEEKDYADALHFARKGLAAAKGLDVMPELTVDWNLSDAEINELSMAYARLISAYDRGARESMPGKSAVAQARYDCWVEEAEETDGDVPCKADFLGVMSELEAGMPAAPAPMAPATEEFPAPVTMIDTNEPLNVQEAVYLVFFDFDKSNVDDGGMSVVNTVVNEIKTRNLSAIKIVGHTDTSGPDAYNDKLAVRRAEAVKSELVKMGVPAANISTEARGEHDLLVQTQDGIREPANRRSVITFE